MDEGDETSEVISFKQNAKPSTSSRNNNVSPVVPSDSETESEGEILSDEDDKVDFNVSTKESNENGEPNMAEENLPGKGRKQAKSAFVEAMLKEQQANKEEFIDAAVAKFQEVFLKSGFMETAANKLQKQIEDNTNKKQRTLEKGKGSAQGMISRPGQKSKLDKMLSKASNLELTVYRNAVENQILKRTSPSSSEGGSS